MVTTRFVVQRHDIRQTGWEDTPTPALPEGAVRMGIDRFALTANNITYVAVLGDAMNYWQFFPAGDPGAGAVPVWGFASVTESRCPGVQVGERFYGYFPIADELVLYPDPVDGAGFVDGVPHRRDLPPIYNRYVRCSADPGYVTERESYQALLRPLFATSVLLDDFLHAHEFFGAGTVILSSASSKTAYGTAFCLSRRQQAVRTVGLTSAANLDFTRSLGCYDDVLTYVDIAALTEAPSAYVDFNGSASIRAAVHRHLGDHLTYDCVVGRTDWDAPGGTGGLPGPAPTLFFAPAWVDKRTEDWGPTGVLERVAAAWTAFMEPVTRPENPWLTVVTGRGRAAVETTYTALLGGTVPAREGHVLSL